MSATTNGDHTHNFGILPNGQKKRILLNAFDMNGVGHIRYARSNISTLPHRSDSYYSVGQWTNPDDKSLTKSSLDYWIHVAKVLESGKINGLFLADNFGSHDVYKGSHATAIKAGCQWPLYDPFVVCFPELPGRSSSTY